MGVGVEGKGLTLNLKVLQRRVAVLGDGITNGVSGRGTILCKHRDAPFAVFQLTEEDHLCLLRSFIANLRIGTTRRQIVLIIELRGIKTADEYTVCIDTLEACIG